MKFVQKLTGSLFEISLVAGALLGICGCSELRLPLGNWAPPSPTVNPLPKYYRASPAMPEQPKVYGTVDVRYRLVDWNDLTSVRNEYSQQGYVPLGQCDFQAPTGGPLQVNAVDYARYLGADLVLYAMQKADNEAGTRHHIDFLTRSRMPGGSQSTDPERMLVAGTAPSSVCSLEFHQADRRGFRTEDTKSRISSLNLTEIKSRRLLRESPTTTPDIRCLQFAWFDSSSRSLVR